MWSSARIRTRIRAWIGLGILAPALVSTGFAAEPEPPEFTRVNSEIAHEYTGGWEHFVGGGVAVFDCDADGFPELFVAGGAALSGFFHNQTQAPAASLSFVENTPPELGLRGVTGAYPLDINSDGHLDLVVLRAGENLLLRGEGACRFQRFAPPGFDGGAAWTTAFSATWEPGQTLPTLAFGNYVDRNDPDGPFEACDENILWRPQTAQTYAPALALDPGHCALSMLFSDWNRAGRADLRISNDRHYYVRDGAEQLWTLAPELRALGAADGWVNHQLWGMGIASRDLTGDGLAEVFLTSMGDQHLHSRIAGAKGPAFENARFEAGMSAHRPHTGTDGRPSTGWHAAFGDVQNDGYDDVFISKGNVDQMMGAALKDPNNLLINQGPGRPFVEQSVAAGVASMARGRGAALQDLNRDGLPDLVVVNRRAPLEIYQNTTAETGNFLGVSLLQSAPNIHAVGAFIELELPGETLRQTREITIGGGHAGGSALPALFGLGAATDLRLRVIWPDGATSPWKTTSAGRYITLSRSPNDATFDITPAP